MLKRTAQLILMAVLLVGALRATPVWAGTGDWNDSEIKWMEYEKGLAAAKETGRPVCLIFFTSWCPHCANYSKVFKDPKLVEKSKSFVMVRLDADLNKELAMKYSPDGGYIPRTFFLSSAGKLDESLSAERPSYKYFYDEASAAGILAGMDRAIAKLTPSK